MIDSDLLRELGWSKDLIDEVSRIAEPMRKTSDKMDFGSRIATPNFSAASSIYAGQSIGSSQVIKLRTT